MSVPSTSGRASRGVKAIALAAVVALVALGNGSAAAQSGSIHPLAIEIDPSANLYPGNSLADCLPLRTGTDWVADCLPNLDVPSLVDSIATGIVPGVTGKVGGTGHWRGIRIVDGLNGNDEDIFLTGGKENDTSTWNVGPGTVGSSKYDASQAYLANNQTNLFFGMERRGNNGTTAFDFEFNQVGAPGGYIPTRTVGDKLFTFEMQGSGNESGSAVGYFYNWDGDSYELTSAPSLVGTINGNTTTPAAPWGHVDSQGNWIGGTLARREFGEASVLLTQAFPGFAACANRAFVQVRTRSSSTVNSDLKDATKIFEFLFGAPDAAATLSTDCLQRFTYGSAGSTNTGGGTTGLLYDWDFTVTPTTALLSGVGVTAVPGVPGVYDSKLAGGTVAVALPAGVDQALVTATNKVSDGSCNDTSAPLTVTVYRRLGATAVLTPACDNILTYSGTATGGLAPYTFSWQFQRNSLADGTGTWSNAGTASGASGTFNPGTPGAYRALLTVTDTAGMSNDAAVTPKPQCEVTVPSNTVNVYDAVGGTLSLTPDCDDTFGFAALGSGGKAPYTYAFTFQKLVAGVWVLAGTLGPLTGTLAVPGITGVLDVDSFSGASGDGTYRALVTITDSQSIVCSKDLTAGPIEVMHPLVATAEKAGADANALSATLSGASGPGAALQWQRRTGPGANDWADYIGGTAPLLVYSGFNQDATPTTTAFEIAEVAGAAAGSYVGLLYSVTFRVRAQRTLNGVLCTAYSPPVLITKVSAVDP